MQAGNYAVSAVCTNGGRVRSSHYVSVSQPPVRGPAPVRAYFSAGPPNKFQHYTTIQNNAFYYNPLGSRAQYFFRQPTDKFICSIMHCRFIEFCLSCKKKVEGEVNLAHNHSFTTSCCSSICNRKAYLTEIQQYDNSYLIMKWKQTSSQEKVSSALLSTANPRPNSFQTVNTLFCIVLPGHLDFISFLDCTLFLAGDWPQTTIRNERACNY